VLMLQFIGTFVGGGLSGVIVTHILYKSKLDKEGQAKVENAIREDIFLSLRTYKELIEDLSSNEIMYAQEIMTDENVDFFTRQPIFPPINTRDP